MLKFTTKNIIKIISYIGASLIAVLLIFLLWVYTGPRSLPFLAHYFSKQISDILPDSTNLNINDIQIGFFDGYKLMLILKDTKVTDTQRGEFVFPEVRIGLDFIGLFPYTQHNLFNLKLGNPKVQLKQVMSSTKDGKLPLAEINAYFKQHREKLLRFSLALNNTSFDLDLPNNQMLSVNVNQFTLKPFIEKNNLLFIIYGDVNIGGKSNTINATFDTSSGEYLSIDGSISNISSKTIMAMGYNNGFFEQSQLKLDLKFHAMTRETKSIEHIDFTFENVEGQINKGELLSQDIVPSEVLIQGQCEDNCSIIKVNALNIKAGLLNLASNFIVKPVAGSQNLSGEFHLGDLPVNRMIDFWPLSANPLTREWMSEHIHDGKIRDVHGKFNVNLDDLINRKALNSEAFIMSLSLEGARLTYMDEVPEIHNINAIITITSNDVAFNIKQAKIKNSDIIKADGKLLDLGTKKSRLSAAVQLQGSAQDLFDLGYAHAGIKNLSFHGLMGTANTDIDVTVPISGEDVSLNNITLAIDSHVFEFSGKKLYENYDLSKGEFKARYRKNLISIVGHGLLNDIAPVKISLDQNLYDMRNELTVTGRLNWKDVHKLGLTKPTFANNSFDFNLLVHDEGNGQLIKTMNFDLASSTIYLKSFGIMKKIGEPGTIQLTLNESGLTTHISEYQINIGNLKSKGEGSIARDFSEIYSLNSPHTKLGNSIFKFTLRKQNTQNIINIEGDSLDLSAFSLDYGDNEKANFSNIAITAKVKEIYFKDGITLHQPTFEIDCTAIRCNKLKIKGDFESKSGFNLDFHYPVFSLTSNNAGQMIQALGISQKIESGQLNLYGKYEGNILTGNLEIEKFNLRQAPLLAKILSLTSFDIFASLANLLGKEGMKFDKLECPFSYNGSIITLDKCEAVGPSLIISGDGDIDLNKDQVSIHGIVASQQNFINRTLGQIPLIGKIITGQDEKGPIGANFKVNGPVNNPKVVANPLSILTPGIFRHLFAPTKKEEH